MSDDTARREKQIARVAEIRHQLSQVGKVGTAAAIGAVVGGLLIPGMGSLIGAGLGSALGATALRKQLSLKRELERELAALEENPSNNGNKGVTLGALGRSDETIAVYDDAVARFGAAAEPALREQAATALVNEAVALGTLGRFDEEIAVYDDVAARFGAAAEQPALREQAAKALVNKGARLGALGRSA